MSRVRATPPPVIAVSGEVAGDLSATAARVIVSVLVATTFVVTLLATRRGPGLSPDSASYLAAGTNLAHGRGLRDFTGEVLTLFPPGLSFVAAAGVKLGLGAAQAVRLANAMAFAATVVLAWMLLRRHVSSVRTAVVAAALVALSPALLMVADRAWTEPLFIATCLALIFVLGRISDARRFAPLMFAAALLVWTAFLLRYIGLVTVPIGAIAIGVGMRRRGVRVAIARAGAFTALASAVPLAWMLRNHEVGGSLLGSRFASHDSLVDTAKRFIATLGIWVLPEPTPTAVQRGVGVIVAIAFVLVVLAFLRRVRSGSLRARDPAGLVPIVTFVVVLSLALVLSQLMTSIDPLNNRLLSPLFVPIVVLSAISIGGLASHTRGLRGRRMGAAVSLVLVLLIGAQAAAFGNHAHIAGVEGLGYQTRAWRRSPLARAVRPLPAAALIASNRPDALWFLTRRQPLEISPSKPHKRSLLKETDTLHAFEHAVACAKSTYLAWFDGRAGFLMPPRDIERTLDLRVRERFPDGVLYEVSGSTRPCEDGRDRDHEARRPVYVGITT